MRIDIISSLPSLFESFFASSILNRAIVNKIVKYSGKNLTITHDLTKPSINTKLALNSQKAFEELGWKPQVSIDQGIQKTIEWYKQNIKDIKWETQKN